MTETKYITSSWSLFVWNWDQYLSSK